MNGSFLTIVADENIPLVAEACAAWGPARLLPGRAIDAAAVQSADVLLVRSVTPVDAALLKESRVRFVGSATIGTDHIDRAYLAERGITFAHAPGSNAESVVEYVLAALLLVAVRRGVALRGRTLGVVGCGQIGSRLVPRAEALGLRVLQNDPPRAEAAEAAGEAHPFVPLDTVLAEADIVTLHVPLERGGRYPTHHLVDDAVLARLRPEAWLVNAARGAVVDNAALRRHLEAGGLGAAIFDVWEGEPTPSVPLIEQVDVATPHIAGYSYDGKVQGTVMLAEALARWREEPLGWSSAAALTAEASAMQLTPPDAAAETAWLHGLVRQMFDLAGDDARLRATLAAPAGERGAAFARLRKHYPMRRTFRCYRLAASAVPEAFKAAVAHGLQVQLVSENSEAGPATQAT